MVACFCAHRYRDGFYVSDSYRVQGVYCRRVFIPGEDRGLPHWELTENHFIDQAKRSVLLDLACMKRRSRDVKSRVSRNLDQAQFSGIESPLGLLKGKSHRLACSRFSSSTDANA
jgi:hypothetical protein